MNAVFLTLCDRSNTLDLRKSHQSTLVVALMPTLSVAAAVPRFDAAWTVVVDSTRRVPDRSMPKTSEYLGRHRGLRCHFNGGVER